MKTYLAGIVVAIAAFSAFAGESVGDGKVYVSNDGVEVAVVTLQGTPPRALVRVTGSGSVFDGKARLHEIVDVGNRIEYHGKFRGRNFYTFHAQKNGTFSLYLPGRRDETRVKFSEEKTKALKPDSVLKDFQKQTKDGSLAALERFDRKQYQAEIQKGLGEELAAAEKQCGAKIPVDVDWASLGDETMMTYSVPGFCSKPADELKRLCETAEGKKWVNAKVKRIQCKLATSGNMSLQVGGDGTLKWSTSTEAVNQEEFARKELMGAPAGDGEPPWGKGETLSQRIALEKTAVCTDGKAHYVVAAPHEKYSTQLYWGDGKSFVEVPPPGDYMTGDTFYDPRHVNPGANPDFRGYDMRVYSSVEANAEKQTSAVHCGTRDVTLKWVPAATAKPLLMGAKFGPTPQKWRPHALFRDEKGTYYYVDRGFKPGEEKRFRLFKGQKGSLKEQKMTNVVADSEGEIFSTKSGSLKMIIDRKQATTWVQGGKATKLRAIPVEENLPLVYNELGVYLGEKMGTPCDDL